MSASVSCHPGTPTHESPVSDEEELGQRVEGNVRARALRVVVRAPELSASGGETTTGNGGGGHSGPETESRVHLESQLEQLSV